MEETTGRIVIGADDRAHLKRAGKWAQFIAIVQFICLGFGFIFGLIMLFAGGVIGAGMPHSTLPAGFFTWYALFILAMCVLGLFLAIYLIRFASKTLHAVEQGNDAVMTEAFNSLGKYFRLQGIVLIVSFVLGIVAGIAASVFASALTGF